MSYIFDFNIHLYSKDSGSIDEQIKSDTELTANDLINNFTKVIPEFKSSDVKIGNFHLFNSYVHFDSKFFDFVELVHKTLPESSFTILGDFRSANSKEYLKSIKEAGFSFVKFHSYVQNIRNHEQKKIVEFAVEVEKQGLGICIDTSYGTNLMFSNDNLALAAEVLKHVKQAPVILLHSGGARVLEAMLLADLNRNVFLETSLSLDYYSGSRIISDFAFAYKKIGFHRVLFASDYPYQSIKDSKTTFFNFAEEYGINGESLRQVLFDNAQRLINQIR